MSKKIFFLLFLSLSLTNLSKSLFSDNSSVILLNSTTFEADVINSKDIWLVIFFAPWCQYCKAFSPEFELAAESLKGVFKLGAVNVDEERDLSNDYGIDHLPTVKFFGIQKENPVEFEEERTAEAIIDFMYQKSKDIVTKRTGIDPRKKKLREMEIPELEGDVYNLNEERFNRMVLKGDEIWLVLFYVPWCEHCKKLMPEYIKAATKVKELKHGQVKLGRIDAHIFDNILTKYEIDAVPTIKTFMGIKGKEKKVYDFYGRRDADGIVTFAMDRIQKLKEETTKGDFNIGDL